MKREFIFSDVIARAKECFGCPSDKALALKLGMSPQTFANRKNTESIPYPEIFSVALECEADVAYILTGIRAEAMAQSQSQSQEGLKPREAALLDNYRAMEEGDQRAIERFALLGSKAEQKDVNVEKKKKAG